MRLTPAQIAMHHLLGLRLPLGSPADLVERVRHGHAWLVQLTRQDFGYDLERWHEYLRATDAGGYRWSNKHLGMPKRIVKALSDPEWQQAVEELRAGTRAEGELS
jgi:hypothetical protein